MADLYALVGEHLEKARTAAHGRSAELLLHDGPLRQSLIVLTTGTELGEHDTPTAATLFVLRGRVGLTTAGGPLELGEGEFAPIPHERHSLTALDDSAVVLTAVTGI
ncbi:cupin [Streptomyces sp. NPDC056486]|uniref:cupin n=1 Tax=Streptomyces sp. NPDC056486 TaxID=3345835 RepID=UPI0036B46B42